MKKLFVFAWAIALIFVLTACANNSDSNSEQSTKTFGEKAMPDDIQPAVLFLNEQTDESLNFIADGLDPVLVYSREFANASDILSDGLLNAYIAANGEDVTNAFREEDQLYHIEVDFVIEYLDQFFAGYVFEPEKVTVGVYNAKENELIFEKIGACTGNMYTVTEREVISDDTVALTVQITGTTNTVKTAILTLLIEEDGRFRYLSWLFTTQN